MDMGQQTVLVIDDAQDIHDIVGARLRSETVDLFHAHDAEEGERLVRERHPDLVLLDLQMPGTDGMALCRILKEDPELMHIPVIFLTGTLDVATKVQAFDLGAVDYVTKPFDAVELKARVRAALRTKRYQDLLTSKAQIDALTGLWNRGYFNDQLGIELSLWERKRVAVALVMVDIDRFKSVNDTHGHPFGDTVIHKVAVVLDDLSRDSDVVCRYGGEEFTVILRDTGAEGAAVMAERMRAAVEALEFRADRQAVPVTASVGVAASDLWPDGAALTADALLQAADDALYRAKRAGRNRVESAGPGG